MALDGGGGLGGLGVIGALAYGVLAVAALRLVLSYKSAAHALRRAWRWADEWAQAYQYYEAAAYVSSLPSLEDADAATVVSSGAKSNDFALQLGPGHTATDAFLGARLAWTNAGADRLVLRVRRHDRTRVLRPYLQHVESVADEMGGAGAGSCGSTPTPPPAAAARGGARWASAPFTHPATLDTVAMDPELKARVRADLETFLKGRAYYHRLGRVWRRSYLLYGAPGTGKSTFAAAMARFLGYDVYDIDLPRRAATTSVLCSSTPPRGRSSSSEDLDRYLRGGDGRRRPRGRRECSASWTGSPPRSCGEERVRWPATTLGLKDHKLYPQVEEGFHAGARLSPAELGEIMLANRGSPSRALRTVISALQHVMPSPPPAQQQQQQQRASTAAARPPKLNSRWSGHLDYASAAATSEASTAGQSSPRGGGGFNKDAPIREFKKLYGLIKYRSRKEAAGVVPVDDNAASPNGRGSEASSDKDKPVISS
ncbi:hypothetical protein HU200_049768 [Digitaria exilis]|uniref:ATPase AAA-type core domain-containing protein n=1 Tax=Digitaria exilis TaxID=1010633 RepID=A0A835EBT9_9POAL|nr:hypothetical protein HU200_049768 [Digitaria exilis]